MTFYGREGRPFGKDVDGLMAEYKSAGLDGFEPIAESPEQLESYGPLLAKHGLTMKSLYVNSALHDATIAPASIETVLKIATAAKKIGCRIIVTNPSPIRWGGPENKSDDQLREQARQLDRLGERLADLEMMLAYHNHDIEMRNAAREFHHMLTATSAKHVKLCLDAHWIFRGSGDSQVALFDIVAHYNDRVVELHLRQSADGIWTESFGDGDIDYARLRRLLAEREMKPHLVLEQAVESKTPKTLTVVEAHRKGAQAVRELFKW